MRHISQLSLAAILLALSAAPLTAQTAKPYDVPRTPWGDPDFQGIFTTDDARGIPLQRPPQFGERATLTEQELAARRQRDDETLEATRAGAGTFVGEVGTRTLNITSLVVDPPDGRIPAITPAAKARTSAASAGANPLLPRSWTDRSLMERCLSRGALGLLPTIYGNGLEIVQAPGVVVLNYEMIHEARVIRLGNVAPPGPAVQTHLGLSRGRWEGTTLVVETTNFNGVVPIGGTRHTSALTLTERLTRVSADTIQYEATVDDPNTWTRPWKIQLPLSTQPGYRVFPFECHEGNDAMRNMLSAARAEERVIEEYVKKGLPPPPLARPGDNQILPPDPSFGRPR
jgi:hypothetical protein